MNRSWNEPTNAAIALLKEVLVRTPPRVAVDDVTHADEILIAQLGILAEASTNRASESMKAMLGRSRTDGVDFDPGRAAHEAVRGDVEVVRFVADELRRRLHEQAAAEEADMQREFAKQQIELARTQTQRADSGFKLAQIQGEESKIQARTSRNIAIASIVLATVLGFVQALVSLLKRDAPPVVNVQPAVPTVLVSVTPPPSPQAVAPLAATLAPSAESSTIPAAPPSEIGRQLQERAR